MPFTAPVVHPIRSRSKQSAESKTDAIGLDSQIDSALLQRIMGGHRAVSVNRVAISPDGADGVWSSEDLGEEAMPRRGDPSPIFTSCSNVKAG